MKKIHHITWSFAISLWIFYYIFDKSILITILYSLGIGSLAWLPDIDLRITHQSWNFTKRTLFLFYPFHLIIKLIFRHRTITHAIWIPLCLFLISKYLIINIYVDAFLLILIFAFVLHILEDALTVSGVYPFYPIPLKFRIGSFNTNSDIHFILLELIGYVMILGFFSFSFF